MDVDEADIEADTMAKTEEAAEEAEIEAGGPAVHVAVPLEDEPLTSMDTTFEVKSETTVLEIASAEEMATSTPLATPAATQVPAAESEEPTRVELDGSAQEPLQTPTSPPAPAHRRLWRDSPRIVALPAVVTTAPADGMSAAECPPSALKSTILQEINARLAHSEYASFVLAI